MDTIDLSCLFCEECLTGSVCGCLLEGDKFRGLGRFLTALSTTGFVQIVGHGIDPTCIEDAVRDAALFFHKSHDYKMLHVSKDRARRGYSPSSTENFASLVGERSVPNDRVEKYRIGPLLSSKDKELDPEYYGSKNGRIHFYPNNDTELAEHFPHARPYYEQLERLSKDLLRLILYASGVDADSLNEHVNKHTSILSLNFYPSLHDTPASHGPQIRVAAHTDVSLFTLVAQFAPKGEQTGSLEVLMEGDVGDERKFVPVPYIPGALVVNVGDCLQYWSHGRFKSAMHRVITQHIGVDGGSGSGGTGGDAGRYSLAYFYSPNHDAVLKWPEPRSPTESSITTAEENETPSDSTAAARLPLNYSAWRTQHIQKAMAQLKGKPAT